VGLEPLSLWLIGIYALAIFFGAPISDASPGALAATVWTRALCRSKKGGRPESRDSTDHRAYARRAR